jgi:hypothetical protein
MWQATQTIYANHYPRFIFVYGTQSRQCFKLDLSKSVWQAMKEIDTNICHA